MCDRYLVYSVQSHGPIEKIVEFENDFCFRFSTSSFRSLSRSLGFCFVNFVLKPEIHCGIKPPFSRISHRWIVCHGRRHRVSKKKQICFEIGFITTIMSNAWVANKTSPVLIITRFQFGLFFPIISIHLCFVVNDLCLDSSANKNSIACSTERTRMESCNRFNAIELIVTPQAANYAVFSSSPSPLLSSSRSTICLALILISQSHIKI